MSFYPRKTLISMNNLDQSMISNLNKSFTSIYKSKTKKSKKIDLRSLGIPERDIEYYREIFRLLDVKNKNILSPNDLRAALEMFGYNLKKESVYQLMTEIDTSEVGGINFEQFVKLMTGKIRPYEQDTEEDYERIFHYFDQDQKGYLTRNDIQRIFLEMNQPITEKQMDFLMQKLDKNKQNKIDFLSFYKNLQEVSAKKIT